MLIVDQDYIKTHKKDNSNYYDIYPSERVLFINDINHKSTPNSSNIRICIHGHLSLLSINNCKDSIIITSKYNIRLLEIDNSRLFIVWNEHGTVRNCTISGNSNIVNLELFDLRQKVHIEKGSTLWAGNINEEEYVYVKGEYEIKGE